MLRIFGFALDLFVSLASPKILTLGKFQIRIFGFALGLFVSLASPKILTLGKFQIRIFGFALDLFVSLQRRLQTARQKENYVHTH